jgi:hypothetical protein
MVVPAIPPQTRYESSFISFARVTAADTINTLSPLVTCVFAIQPHHIFGIYDGDFIDPFNVIHFTDYHLSLVFNHHIFGIYYGDCMDTFNVIHFTDYHLFWCSLYRRDTSGHRYFSPTISSLSLSLIEYSFFFLTG